LATTGTRIPVIWQKQDCARDGRLALFIARRCGLVVGVSNAVLATFDGQHSLERTVIPNAIPVYEVDREEARARLLTTIGVQGEAAVVGQVARLHPAKGQLELLEVAARLRPDIPDLHLVFIGDPDPCEPDYPSRLRSRCADLGIDGSVRFLGHRNDAVTLMAGCDVLALPSLPDPVSGWREGFPLSSLEAMAVGTPVVGYDEPALVEQLGNCGRLVPSGDREALCSVLGEVLADASVQEDMRACGRRRGRRYELPGAVRQLKDAFVETAVRRPGRVSG
jgi:glycosyltransferase involved in cell wall biosynthesis